MHTPQTRRTLITSICAIAGLVRPLVALVGDAPVDTATTPTDSAADGPLKVTVRIEGATTETIRALADDPEL